jgi:large subunit ribosomal protein L15
MNFLLNLSKTKEQRRQAKRIGRGIGSGKGGHYSTRGGKGQKARTGGQPAPWFEGGQTPLVHGMPYKGGFINHNSNKVFEINLEDLSQLKFTGKTITPEQVLEQSFANGEFDFVKILSKGKIEKALNLEGFSYSEKAKKKIEAAGGKAV